MRVPLTWLGIGARILLNSFRLVFLDPTVRSLMRAKLSVVLAESSESMLWSVLLDEVFCDLDLSTR